MRHPEQLDDEAFISNTKPMDFIRFGWRTKRAGDVAYARDGSVVPSLLPIFVRHSEILKQPSGAITMARLQKAGHW